MNKIQYPPIVHSILNLHHMIKEFFLIPFHLRIQKRDWNLLCKIYPGLDKFYSQKRQIKDNLKIAYKDYIANYSASLISLSLDRGVFFYYLCQLIRPAMILDLGSGFSSFIFRRYSKDTASVASVLSIDDSEFWLNQTADFLKKHDVSADGMQLWNNSQQEVFPEFSIAFLDIGTLEMRLKLLPDLIHKIKFSSGIILIDDFHVPFYRKKVREICKMENINIYSLRKVTRTRLSHNALIQCR